MSDFIKDLTETDLPNDDMRFLADVVGLDVVKKMLLSCPGMTFYIPQKPAKDFRMAYIEAHYDPESKNSKKIAKELEISDRTFFRLLSSKGRRKVA